MSSRPDPSPGRIHVARTVLVIDDNGDVAEVLCQLLKLHGATAKSARSGEEALQILAGWTPDFALIDLGMPVMDGYEVAQRIRQQPHLKTVRLIALTGRDMDEDRSRTHQSGFEAHLLKPVAMEALLAMLARP